MWGKKTLFAGVIFSAFVMALLANSFSAEAGRNCQSKLVGNFYNCNTVDEDLGPQPGTFEFGTGGISRNFDLCVANC